MDRIIVYLDDAEYARQQLAPMVGGADAPPTQWVLVACAPHMTRHISKWVTHSARESWRERWADKLFAAVVSQLRERGDEVTTVLAKGPLPQLTKRLSKQHATARVLDARRPKFGQNLAPVTADQPASHEERWSVPGAVLGLGAVLVLAAE